MLALQHAGKRFGPRVLFLEADWLIRNDEKTALVGANGAGKSTLMKILAGLETLDYGSLEQTRGISTGYLPQEGLRLAGRTVFEECLTVFDELHEMQHEIERLAGQMAELDHESAEYESAAERYSLLQDRFHALDGYALDAQVGSVLTGLGFGKEDWARQTDEFSGGWQMRIALAKLLLAKPNLLLLDEPTNHLDLETRNWLEDYLRTYPFGYILISHDRYFLDVTIDRTVEIWNKRLTIYQGNYTKYLKQKDERREQLMAAYRNQRERIEHLEAFINRFRYQATKAKQVQSRIKELEKIERIEVPEEEAVIHFKFPQPPTSGRMVAEAEGLAKSYGPKQVFAGARFTIERGDRVALVGVNGAGKSTLIKLLTGVEAPTAGSIRLGHNVVAEYFAQDQYKVLDAEARMLDDISRAAFVFQRCRYGRCWGVFSSRATTSSSRSACSRAASAIATLWRGFSSHRQTSCCSTSPRIIWTCAPKTCCLKRLQATAVRWSSFPTTATSSIAWPRACLRLRTAPLRRTRATTKTICGGRARWPCPCSRSRRLRAAKSLRRRERPSSSRVGPSRPATRRSHRLFARAA